MNKKFNLTTVKADKDDKIMLKYKLIYIETQIMFGLS